MYLKGLKCLKCGEEFPPKTMFEGCPECRTDTFVSNLTVVYEYEKLREKIDTGTFKNRHDTVWKYLELLPVDNPSNIVSLSEGGTPLLHLENTEEKVGLRSLYLKDESRNPTWSFKDRLCSVAISKAIEFGAKTITVSSTGNHGASTAAYSARAKLPCVIFTMPQIPFTMRVLMQIYGAMVLATPTPKDRWEIMSKCIEEFNWYPTGNYVFPVVGSNPYGIEGYKTIAFEICEQLNWETPDYVAMPVGYGDGLVGTWKGFKEFYNLGFIDSKPKMIGIEAIGPLTNALEKGLDFPEEVKPKQTIAFSIGTNVSTYQALKTLKESKGLATTVSDEEIVEMQKCLAREGFYVEAASAACVAGIKKLVDEGKVDRDGKVVAVLTSSGLKDPISTREVLPEVPVIPPEIHRLKEVLKNVYSYSIG